MRSSSSEAKFVNAGSDMFEATMTKARSLLKFNKKNYDFEAEILKRKL